MLKFFQKRQTSILYSKLVLILLFGLTLFLIHAAWKAYTEKVQTRDQLSLAENDFNDLSLRANVLAEDIESLKTEEGVEREIRSKFSVAKEGEKVAVVVEEPLKKDEGSEEKKLNFFQNLWQMITGVF